MTARDTAALTAQVDALAAQVERLASLVKAIGVSAETISVLWEQAYAAGVASTRAVARTGQPGHGRTGNAGHGEIRVIPGGRQS